MTKENMIEAMQNVNPECLFTVVDDYTWSKHMYSWLIRTVDLDGIYGGGLEDFWRDTQNSGNFSFGDEYCLLVSSGGLETSGDVFELLEMEEDAVDKIADWLIKDDQYMQYSELVEILENLD